jgi:hypothetical protein
MSIAVKAEIQRAIERLGLSEREIALLQQEEGKSVYLRARSHFATSATKPWWWEDFRFPTKSIQCTNQSGFEYLTRIVPNQKEKVWFIAGDSQATFIPVYEAKPEAIQNLLGECFGFEYYLIAKDFSWLICENHHDLLIVIGDEVGRKLNLTAI